MEDVVGQASSPPHKTVIRPLVMNLISHSSESLSTDGEFPVDVTGAYDVTTTTDEAHDVAAPQDAMESSALPEASEAPVPQAPLDSSGQPKDSDLTAEAQPFEVPAQEAPAQVEALDTQEEPRPSVATEDPFDADSASEEKQASVTDDSLIAGSTSKKTISGEDAEAQQQEIEQSQEPGEEPE